MKKSMSARNPLSLRGDGEFLPRNQKNKKRKGRGGD